MADKKPSEIELEKVAQSLTKLQHHPDCECDQCENDKNFSAALSKVKTKPKI